MPRRAIRIVLSLFVLTFCSKTHADRCRTQGAMYFPLTPYENSTVASSVRFLIALDDRCSEFKNGPAHQFRLVDGKGKVIPSKHSPHQFKNVRCRGGSCGRIEIVPDSKLPTGQVTVEIRGPVSPNKLGNWKTVTKVSVQNRTDTIAPRFKGIKRAFAKVEKGIRPLNPCQVKASWVVQTHVLFSPADDSPTEHNELFYFLDRQENQKAPWFEWRGFRPSPKKQGLVGYDFDSFEWDKTFRYRIRVLDASGNMTTSVPVTVSNPSEPSRPISWLFGRPVLASVW